MRIQNVVDEHDQWRHSPGFHVGMVAAIPVLALMLIALGTCRIHAQVLYGTIVGNVADQNGALMVGATVMATRVSTGEIRTAETDEEGTYTLSNVPTGEYRIAISKSGFKDFLATGISVGLNAVARVDAKLQVGAANLTVTVNASAVQLQTDSAEVSGQIESEQLMYLPQPTRTYQGVLINVPGVLPPGIASGGTVGSNNTDNSMSVQANGTNTSATDVRIEGVTAAQPWVPYRSSLTPSVEAIESVNMVTATADASQSLASGATINVQLKSGTNEFHGEAYEYHVDNTFAARPYFYRTGDLPKNVNNDYGGTLGGPIIKKKLFFFASYEGLWSSSSQQVIMTVPTPAMLTGDFTAGGACATTASAPACTTLYDPTTGNANGEGKLSFIQEYGSNKIPASMISAQVKPLLPLLATYPPSATPPTPSSTPYLSNFSYVVPKPNLVQKWDTKADLEATKKLRLTGRYNNHPYDLIFPSSGPAYLFNITSAHSFGRTTSLTAAATYVASPNLVLNGTWGYTRSVEHILPPFGNQAYAHDTLGIPGTNLGPMPEGGGLPNFTFNTYSSLGYSYPYMLYKDGNFVYAGSATLSHGRNTLKFGMLVENQVMDHIENTPTSIGFGGNATTPNISGAFSTQFNSFADFLMGLPSSWANSVLPYGSLKIHAWEWSAYITNSQQIGRNLTVNYGSSWQYFPFPTRGSRGLEYFDQSTNPWQYEICGVAGIPKSCGVKSSWALLGPHVGFAYRVNPSFVVRGGAAIAPEQFNMARNMLNNYPMASVYRASALNSYVPVGSLAAGIPTLPAPDITPGVIPLPAGANFATVPKRIVRGYTQSYNLTLEKQLGGWLFQTGYVGTTSVHQHTDQNLNYGQVGGGVASGALYKFNGTTGSILSMEPLIHTNYNSLQTTVQKHLSQNYQMMASYTWARWLGTCCDTNGFGSLNIPIPQYIRLNYAPMPGDRKGILTITGVAQSPFGKGKQFQTRGLGAYILGGWELNAQELILSGTPFSVGAPGNSLNAPGSTQRADQVKSTVAINHGNTKQYFDTSAFAAVTTARFGTASYNSLRAPGAANLDASIFRSFQFRERYKAQFRMEAFNVTNSPHFGAPSATVGSASIGNITSTSPISRVNDARSFRFGAKFLF